MEAGTRKRNRVVVEVEMRNCGHAAMTKSCIALEFGNPVSLLLQKRIHTG
jgi:hypothetical protein